MSNTQSFDNPYTEAGADTTPAKSQNSVAERVSSQNDYRKGKKTGKEIIGSSIYSLADGVEVGKVHDLIYNPAQGRLVGVTIEVKGGFLSGGRTLLLRDENIHSLGEDAITVQSQDALQEIKKKVSDFAEEAGEAVLGKRLLTDDGSFLGKVDDVLVERESRRIVAYEVSGGTWNDLMRGQTDVPVDKIVTIGPDVVVVPASVKHQVIEVSGGLLGNVNALTEKASDLADTAAEKAKQGYEVAATKVEELRSTAAEKIEDSEIKYAIGRTAGATVKDGNDRVIVEEGQTITEGHVQQALAADRMHALAASAGRSHASEIGENIKETAASATESLKETAASAQESFKDKQGELLIGRTAGRDVKTNSGELLVPGGTTITAEQVSIAREHGLLGDLSAAVAAKALDSAGESVKETYQNASESVKETYSDAKDAYREGKAQSQAEPSGTSLPVGTHNDELPVPASNPTVIKADTVIIDPSTNPVTPPTSPSAQPTIPSGTEPNPNYSVGGSSMTEDRREVVTPPSTSKSTTKPNQFDSEA